MAKATHASEREFKFGADLDFELPDLRGIVGGTERLPDLELRTIYFDTDDLRLWSSGLTLRHRLGEDAGGDGLWTLKVPVDGPATYLERQELTWPGRRDAIPDQARSLLSGTVRHRELTAIVELSSTRRRLVLHDRAGRIWAEVDDDTVTVAGGPRDGNRFRQLEVELRGDAAGTVHRRHHKHARRGAASADTADVVADRLREAGATEGDGQKLARALGLDARKTPVGLLLEPALDRRSSIGDVVRASIADGYSRLCSADLPLRFEPDAPPVEAVHQARVATRRLRSDLKALGLALDPVWVRNTRGELKWLGEILGRVRDADVLEAQLLPSKRLRDLDLNGIDDLRAQLTVQRQSAMAALNGALDSERYLLLLDRLHAAAARPPFEDRGAAADAAARRVLPAILHGRRLAVARKVTRAVAGHRNPNDLDLHQIRIQAKKVRYVAETAIPVLGKSAARTANAAEALQSILGNHHDAVVAGQWLTDEVSSLSPAGAYAAGALSADNLRRQEALRQKWRPAWKSLSHG